MLQAAKVPLKEKDGAVTVQISEETPRALRQALGRDDPFIGRFDLPLQEGECYLGRTSPIVEGVAGWTLDQALDPVARDAHAVAARCGIMSTAVVAMRTTLVLARFRYHLKTTSDDAETILCEEIVPLACTGPADNPHWLSVEESEPMLAATPDKNLIPTAIEQQLGLLLKSLDPLQQSLASIAIQRAQAQLESHERVREASKTKGRITIEPVLPVDILGGYILLPRL